jgi:hypothetical protein
MLRITENRMWRRMYRLQKVMMKVTALRIHALYFLLGYILLFTSILCYFLFWYSFTFYVGSILLLLWFYFTFYLGFALLFTMVVPLYLLVWFYFGSAVRKKLSPFCDRRPFLLYWHPLLGFLKYIAFEAEDDNPEPSPKLGSPGTNLSSGSCPSTCLACVILPGAHALAITALQMMWTR